MKDKKLACAVVNAVANAFDYSSKIATKIDIACTVEKSLSYCGITVKAADLIRKNIVCNDLSIDMIKFKSHIDKENDIELAGDSVKTSNKKMK